MFFRSLPLRGERTETRRRDRDYAASGHGRQTIIYALVILPK